MSVIDDYVSFLSLVHWQVYGTFTFPKREAGHRANRTFTDFFSLYQSHVRTEIGWLRADEVRPAPSGLGKPPSGIHFHFLLASRAQLNAESIETLWKNIVGRGFGFDRFGSLTLGGYAMVRPYNPNQDGLGYALKGLMNSLCDYKFSDNLFLFLPAGSIKLNTRMNRKLNRSLNRYPANLGET